MKAERVVDGLLEAQARWHEHIAAKPGTLARQLFEMPQYYPGAVVYQTPLKFTPISLRNFESYEVLGQDSFYVYVVDPQHTMGFAFDLSDVEAQPQAGLVPALQLQLRDSGIDGLRQAFRLRVQEAHARRGVATSWYVLFAARYGLVSDFEHLEGGKQLWRSLVDNATRRGLRVFLADAQTGERHEIGPETADEDIWSADEAKKNWLLILVSDAA